MDADPALARRPPNGIRPAQAEQRHETRSESGKRLLESHRRQLCGKELEPLSGPLSGRADDQIPASAEMTRAPAPDAARRQWFSHLRRAGCGHFLGCGRTYEDATGMRDRSASRNRRFGGVQRIKQKRQNRTRYGKTPVRMEPGTGVMTDTTNRPSPHGQRGPNGTENDSNK